MSESLEETCARDPVWAASEIRRLRLDADKAGVEEVERRLIALKIHLGVPFEKEHFPANAMHREAAAVIVKWLRGTAMPEGGAQ